MRNRSLHQLPIMGFAFVLVCITSAARAEPTTQTCTCTCGSAAPQQASASASTSASALSARRVSLADADVDTDEDRNLPNRPLLYGSTALFTAAYVPTFLTALANSKDTDGTLYLPVLGPWLELNNDTSPGNKLLLVASGVAQTAGAAGMISSFFVPRSRTQKWPIFSGRRLSFAPAAGRGSYHLVARGSF